MKFKAFLVENNIKQSEVADLLGINRNLLNAKLNGKKKFTLEQVSILCRHFNISADVYFLD